VNGCELPGIPISFYVCLKIASFQQKERCNYRLLALQGQAGTVEPPFNGCN
jgi:hypothetical protein